MMAFNPCPVRLARLPSRPCTCDPALVRRHSARLSGPLRDRIDLWVVTDEPRAGSRSRSESSAEVAARIAAAWSRQLARQGVPNGDLGSSEPGALFALGPPALRSLASLSRTFRISPRRYQRAAAVARTIADLEGAPVVEPRHVEEALRYRAPTPT